MSRALAEAGLRELLVHTGQHFDPAMSDIFFDELNIPAPAYNLDINSLTHGAMTGRMIEEIERVLLQEKPDLVLVYGDTNSTIAGALAAAKLHIPVAHVEAGLRSFNRRMPEEVNRVVTDHLSDILFCPTQTAVANLKTEGLVDGVHAVGDVMYDATLAAIEQAAARSEILEKLQLTPKSYAVCTIHRAENTDDPVRFAKVAAWLADMAKDIPIVMAVHPRTRKLLSQGTQALQGVRLVDPLGYLDMTQLMHHACAAYTDSGGLQKEAYFHQVPCVTLRDETEWVETIEAGWNRLWTQPDYRPRHPITEYGTGDASRKIAQVLRDRLDRTPS